MKSALLSSLAVVLAAAAASAAPARPKPPLQHRLEVRLEPESSSLSATDHIRLRSSVAITFTLAPELTVDRLVVDGKPVQTAPAAGRWTLHLDGHPEHDVRVDYHGRFPRQGNGAGGTDLAVGTSGTFLAGGGWYPTIADGALSYDLSVRLPRGQVAVSPGKILSEETTDEGYRARFASEWPADDIALFAGPYEVAEKRHRGRRLRTYFAPEVADLAQLYLDKVASYLDLYEGWIGAYPYSFFDVVSGPLPVGLGFPGLTYIGANVLRLPFLPRTSLGHEVLHSWWGNGVFIDLSEGNWAEGLTTFMADYTYAERKGADEARDMRLRWLREYAVLPPERDRPLTAFRSRGHTASQVVGYHKAAMVFLMLRDRIGSAAFDAGVRRFWKEQRFRFATWSDLRRAFEAASGTALDTFFRQWLERTGAPSLSLEGPEAKPGKGAFAVSFTLAQSEPPYALEVPVEVDADRAPVSESLPFSGARRHYEIGVARRPRSLAIDPDFRLFRRLARAEVPPILRGVAFDAGAATVVAADGGEARAAAREVAAHLFEQEPRFVDAAGSLPAGPVLVVGTTTAVEKLLAGWKQQPPARVAGKGTARAWAARRPEGETLLAVEGDDAAALRAIAGPLPHYGSESFLVFDGRKAIDEGIWSPEASPLRVVFPH
jgi:aminopeptidase N